MLGVALGSLPTAARRRRPGHPVGPVRDALRGLFVRNRATREQALELLMHRSVYTLKEADPHTWTVPRLVGAPKVALVELQYDEYGAGIPGRQHARMFADALDACGLDPSYGGYVDVAPAPTLAVSNV